jgi:phage-related protein
VQSFTSETGRKPVQDWMLSLDAEARAAVLVAIKELRMAGIHLEYPMARHLDDGIWELRVRDARGIYRVLYFHWRGRTFGLLHGFTKKTRATPTADLALATTRRNTRLARAGHGRSEV